MKKLSNEELRAWAANNAAKTEKRDETFIPGLGYEVDLTKENCSTELWEELGGDDEPLTDEEYQKFLKGEPL